MSSFLDCSVVCRAYRVDSVESVLLSWPLRGLENHQESFRFQETWGEEEEEQGGANGRERGVDAVRQWLSVFFNTHKLSWMCVLLQILLSFIYLCLITIVYHHALCIFTKAYIYLFFWSVFLLHCWRYLSSEWFSKPGMSWQTDSCFNKCALDTLYINTITPPRRQRCCDFLQEFLFSCVQNVVFSPKLPGWFKSIPYSHIWIY